MKRSHRKMTPKQHIAVARRAIDKAIAHSGWMPALALRQIEWALREIGNGQFSGVTTEKTYASWCRAKTHLEEARSMLAHEAADAAALLNYVRLEAGLPPLPANDDLPNG